MSMKEGILVGLGNPLLDISAHVDEEFLKKYDLKPNNAILAEEKHMPLYDELLTLNAELIAGGSVQNSLRVAQWILNKANVAVFFGCVGNDNNSKLLEERARCAGVNVQYQHCEVVPTGTCGVMISGLNRSLCANLAAANHFTIDHLQKPENKKFIDNAEYFYISGFFLTVSLPSILSIARHANENNRTFIMNLSAPFITTFFKSQLAEALAYVDILFGNEEEATTFAEQEGWDKTNLKEIGKKLAALPKINKNKTRIVIITQGADPVLLFQGGDSITEFPVVRLSPAELVDTNGAGDAFAGGFLAQYIQKKPLETCIRCGIWAATKIICRSGCTFTGKADFEDCKCSAPPV